jgi:hypothetical protein
MGKSSRQIEKEIKALRKELDLVAKKEAGAAVNQVSDSGDGGVPALLKYMIEERERTNRILAGITEKINRLEKEFGEAYQGDIAGDTAYAAEMASGRELPLSGIDAKIIGFAQSKGMVCADEVREFMGYKGRNAACARLNKLYKDGLLDRFQLGHKVYYKFDAGKTTNTLIISPPQ